MLVMQSQVLESKEEHVHRLTKEICEWRLECQELRNVQLEKLSLSSKLTSANNDRDNLQVCHVFAFQFSCLEFDIPSALRLFCDEAFSLYFCKCTWIIKFNAYFVLLRKLKLSCHSN